MNFKKLLDYLKNEKNRKEKFSNFIIVALIAVLIIIVASFFKTTDSMTLQNNDTQKQPVKANSSDSSSGNYETSMENKLKDTLEKIDGVGNVEVMMYFSSSEEQVPAFNENKSNSVTDETDTSGGKRTTTQTSDGNTVVTSKDGDKESPLIVKEYKPTITGVCVVAEGASNDVVKLNITNAVVDLFGITSDKVNVYPMKK
ncbi:stage III sporulation protein AG [Clostridium hydrogenum]|uniref:stage III sporulation protein AG n=1 Tax=Clostridium hydrogenum TaxID=2855764 RepID=UPI001F445B60|nr:stage III sporulation protein AG [Clostridium hydrogenum]